MPAERDAMMTRPQPGDGAAAAPSPDPHHGPTLRRREFLGGCSALALSAPLVGRDDPAEVARPAADQPGEPWDDGTYWDDGTGWV
jgi:hypothetical protein